MQNNSREADATVILSAAVVFGLPLAVLIPGFSIWDVVPKVRVHRFHILSQHLNWSQFNTAAVGIALLFFCLFLEFRKRILDDVAEEVLTVKQATITTMEAENNRQAATMRACVQLLDASKDHYENLVLLQDELRRLEKKRNHPPMIELNSSEIKML